MMNGDSTDHMICEINSVQIKTSDNYIITIDGDLMGSITLKDMIECTISDDAIALNITKDTLLLYKTLYDTPRTLKLSMARLEKLMEAERLLNSPVVCDQLSKAIAHILRTKSLIMLLNETNPSLYWT